MKKYVIVAVAILGMGGIRASFNKDTGPSKADLGKSLFFDPILSRNWTVSCASCHKPAFAFADTFAFSKGIYGKKGVRNTPTAMNLLLQHTFFWDGRAMTLEEQALSPIENPVEMNLPIEIALQRLRTNARYNGYFKKIFGTEPTRKNLAEAIAAYERTLETSDSPFDNWKFFDDPASVSDAVKRGFAVFNEKGKCVKCHFGSNFTTNEFRNIGLFDGHKLKDSGRSAITKLADDLGKFKVPGLRNVAITPPYMHNGMFRTLDQVIDFYNDPGKIIPGAINRDSLLSKPLGLTSGEKDDLKAFLLSLTDKQFSSAKR